MNKILPAFFIVVFCYISFGCEEQAKGLFLERGVDFFEQGKYKESELEIKNAIQEDPSISKPYYYMALLNEKAKKYKAMKANLLKAVKLAPENIKARLKLSKVYLLFNEIDDASKEIESILQNSPNELDALAIKASIYIKQKNIAEAMLVIDNILAENSEHIEALSLKVIVLIKEKSYDAALLIIEPAIKKNSENISLHLLKIQLNSLLNNVDAVVAGYERLVELQPDNPQVTYSLAKIYLKANKPQKAEDTLKRLIDQNPDLMQFKIALLDFIYIRDEEESLSQADDLLNKYQDEFEKIVMLSKWLVGKNKESKAQERLKAAIVNEAISEKNKTSINLLLAQMEFKRRKFTEALKYIDHILAKKPDSAGAKVLKAEIQIVTGKYDDAIVLLKEILWQQPKMDKAVSLIARVHEVNGDLDKAVVNYENALRLNSGNLEALNFIVRKEVSEGHTGYAIELLERALRRLPSNLMLMIRLVELNFDEKNWDIATQYINNIKLQKNGLLIAEYLNGKILQQQNKYAEAIVFYKKLLEKAPWIKEALSGVVDCYVQLNQQANAKLYVNELINNHSDIVFPYIVKSQLLAAENKAKQAISFLVDAMEQEKIKNPSINIELARLYSVVGDKESEKQTYLKGLRAWPKDISLMIHLALFFEGEKSIDKAVEIYELILQNDPRNSVAKNNLATLLLDHYGEEKDIIKAAQIVSSFKQAKQPYFLDTYGWAKLKLGDVEKALSIFKQVTILEPNVPIFRYHLAVAYNNLGDEMSASSELKQALSLGKSKNFPEKGLIEELLVKLKNK